MYDIISVIITIIKEDLSMNSKVLRNLSYGVYIVSTLDGQRPTGCVANSIMQITSSPATIAVSMNHDNYTHSCIEKNGTFAVSILSEQSDPSLIGQFGFQTGKDVNKFDSVDFTTVDALPVINNACGYLTCKVIDKMETSTHTVFLAEVMNGDTLESAPAMTYAYYHKVVKGKSPKNAPTYIAEEDNAPSSSSQWVCSICGYIYDGDIPFEELPEDYVCPVCKMPKDKFVLK